MEEELIWAIIFVMDRSGSDTSFRAVQNLIREDGGSKPGKNEHIPFCLSFLQSVASSKGQHTIGDAWSKIFPKNPNYQRATEQHEIRWNPPAVLILVPPSGGSSVGPSLCENKLLGTGRRDPRCLPRRNETCSTWHGPCTCWPQGPGRRPHAVTLPRWHCAGLCE